MSLSVSPTSNRLRIKNIKPFRKVYGQMCFAYRAAQGLNELPSDFGDMADVSSTN